MKLSIENLEIYNQIDKILWQDWDPIGINGEISARNEYSQYVNVVYSLKMNGKELIEIADYLFKSQKENLGIEGNLNFCIEIAHKIIDIKKS